MEALALAERTCEEKLHSLTQAKVGIPVYPECFGQAKTGAAVLVCFSKHHETQTMGGLALASECLLCPPQCPPTSYLFFPSLSPAFLFIFP